MSRRASQTDLVRPEFMWVPVSPTGWIYHYGIRRTRAAAIDAWNDNDPTGPSWDMHRRKGWRMVRVVVTPFVDPAQLRDVEVPR